MLEQGKSTRSVLLNFIKEENILNYWTVDYSYLDLLSFMPVAFLDYCSIFFITGFVTCFNSNFNKVALYSVHKIQELYEKLKSTLPSSVLF